MNPFYQSFQKSQNAQPRRAPRNAQEAVSSMLSYLSSIGMTPEQKVRQMLQTEEMSQAQFEQLSALADIATGRKR